MPSIAQPVADALAMSWLPRLPRESSFETPLISGMLANITRFAQGSPLKPPVADDPAKDRLREAHRRGAGRRAK